MAGILNPKLQIPNSNTLPTSKSQTNSQNQLPIGWVAWKLAWDLEVESALELGIWILGFDTGTIVSMPIFEYRCSDCDREFEAYVSAERTADARPARERTW